MTWKLIKNELYHTCIACEGEGAIEHPRKIGSATSQIVRTYCMKCEPRGLIKCQQFKQGNPLPIKEGMTKAELLSDLNKIHQGLNKRKYRQSTDNLGILIYCLEQELTNS